MVYTPTTPPPVGPELQELSDWLRDELETLARSLVDQQEVELRVRFAAPEKPRAGMVVYADGTLWDPGEGAGQYTYNGSAWVKTSVASDFGALALLDTVNTAQIDNDAVTDDKLANMPANTIKGRNEVTTGNPENLSVAEVTAMLNAFTGDSGSGGVKGLVPAPASGDAAAEKYLHADGTWKVLPVTASVLVNYDEVRSGITTGTTYSAGANIVNLNYAADSSSNLLKVSVDIRWRTTTGAGGGNARVGFFRDSTELFELGGTGGGSVGISANGEASRTFIVAIPDTSSHTYSIRWTLASGNISSFLVNASSLYSPLIILEELLG